MSSGPFTLSSYITNNGDVVPIKLQPETLTVTFAATANAAPTGAVQSGWPSADVSRSQRAIGIHARSATVKVLTATGDATVGSTIRIPVPSKTVWDGIAKAQAVTFTGGTGQVRGKTDEKIV